MEQLNLYPGKDPSISWWDVFGLAGKLVPHALLTPSIPPMLNKALDSVLGLSDFVFLPRFDRPAHFLK
jgi:hypothetical protein